MHSIQNNLTLKDPFPIWESKLVGRWGIGRSRLQELRESHLVLGVDFVKKGRRICLTAGAVDKLEVVMGLREKNAPPGATDALAEPLKKPVSTFKVYRKLITHPHMILATDGKEIYRVRVKTKEHFLPGMEIRCEHDKLDLYNHVGNCPRFRGKY